MAVLVKSENKNLKIPKWHFTGFAFVWFTCTETSNGSFSGYNFITISLKLEYKRVLLDCKYSHRTGSISYLIERYCKNRL